MNIVEYREKKLGEIYIGNSKDATVECIAVACIQLGTIEDNANGTNENSATFTFSHKTNGES